MNDYLNVALVIAYVAFNLDIISQVVRIHREKDSIEVSSWGVVARVLASAILLARFIAIDDIYLAVGQTFMVINLLVYLGMVICYRKPRNNRGD